MLTTNSISAAAGLEFVSLDALLLFVLLEAVEAVHGGAVEDGLSTRYAAAASLRARILDQVLRDGSSISVRDASGNREKIMYHTII